MKKSTTNAKNQKKFYAFGTYKPNKNAKPVTYKGTEYLSKAQCMALEGITRKELDAYLAEVQNVVTEEDLVETEITDVEEEVEAIDLDSALND